MKIKLDENMPASLAAVLSACGHDTDTVPEEDLTGKPDPDVWRETQHAGRFLITQDLDFSVFASFGQTVTMGFYSFASSTPVGRT